MLFLAKNKQMLILKFSKNMCRILFSDGLKDKI